MSSSPAQISAHFTDAFRHLGGKIAIPRVDVRFYPYVGISNRMRIRSGCAYVRLSDILEDAPDDVLRALAFILVSKVLAKKPAKNLERVYQNYICSPELMRASEIARRERGHKKLSSARGHYFDLEKMFRRINAYYFDSELEKPVLSWSQRRTHRILGHHDSVHDTIIISKTLDAPDVPEWFVEFVLYHEMLHIKHSARLINGRRYHHTPAFRADERRFPMYQAAQEWLESWSYRQRNLRARAA
jgi:hypothetical protein